MVDVSYSLLLHEGEQRCIHQQLLNSSVYCTQPSAPIVLQIIIAFSFTFLIISSITGNIVVMWIIYRHKVMHHAFNFFLFNMALADLLIAVFNVGTSWTYNVYYDWWYGDLCPITLFFGVAPTCVSVFSMMALSWDRCQAVVNPLYRRPISMKGSFIRISIIWFISSIIALPNVIYYEISNGIFYNIESNSIEYKSSCYLSIPTIQLNQWIFPFNSWYDRCLFILQYAIPLVVLTLTFTRIAHVLRCGNKMEILRSSTNRSIDPVKAKRKVIKMVALMVGVFMICWFPYHLYHTFIEIFEFETGIGYTLVYWLAMAPCATNPLIYCYTNKRFRIGFRYVFRRFPFVKCEHSEYSQSALFSNAGRSQITFKNESKDKSEKKKWKKKNSSGETDTLVTTKGLQCSTDQL